MVLTAAWEGKNHMRGKLWVLGLAALLATTALAACGSASRVTYIPAGSSYTAASLAEALEESNPGAAARVTIDEAPDVRQSALADLRTNGDQAARLADMLTSEFPTDVLAVPYAIERGTYDGEAAWIVFEAWTTDSTELSGRRVWVFADDDLTMLAAHSVR